MNEFLYVLSVFAVEPSLLENITNPVVLVALISALVGGLGLKFVDHFLNRKKSQSDMATQIRDELRKDMLTLKTHFDNCEDDKSVWQDKYWLSVEENAQLKAAQALINAKMQWVEKIVDDEHPNNPKTEKLKELPM